MKHNTYSAIVVGSGAAGLAAAARLKELDVDVALVTENINAGTSRNTGSDKQTYYKLTLGGDNSDSVAEMAQNLFSFGAVDGDNALCEAALSPRCFFSLVEGGVPFPHNKYGEYIGYKTDHDPYKRATSAGPLTSKFMTEMWEKRVKSLSIPIYDGYLAIEILQKDNQVCGLTVLHKQSGEISAMSTPYVILATGGPAGIYMDSVYPQSQTGATGLAIDAGATLQNLTEWQYGLASVSPRWNVSGTYMQVLPRFVSVDENGNEHEFLADYFDDPYEAMSQVFLKGYQWPFDSKKIFGSSVIDLLVFFECTHKNRRVYLDYTKNPFGLEQLEYGKLSPAAYDYLSKADALFGTPIDRLKKMNMPAIELYKSKRVDITREYLEIALCAQHHNGGIAVDSHWMTNISGLFAIGECAGTHGISRPGGSALNAGQVGALRAAQYIFHKRTTADEETFTLCASKSIAKHSTLCNVLLSNNGNTDELISTARRNMSDVGAAIRSSQKIEAYLCEVSSALERFDSVAGISDAKYLYKAYKYRDILLTQKAVLSAILSYEKAGYASRGSAIICDEIGILPQGLNEYFRFRQGDNIANDKIQELKTQNSKTTICFRPVRPIPQEDSFFENVWREYRENGCIE